MVQYSCAVDALERQFAFMNLKDECRKSNRLTFPDITLVKDFDVLAVEISGKDRATAAGRKRIQTSFFGAPPIVVAKLWELIVARNTLMKGAKRQHLYWALHYMKQYPDITCMRKTMATAGKLPDEKTVSKWVWYFISLIEDLEEDIIKWSNRKAVDYGADCLASLVRNTGASGRCRCFWRWLCFWRRHRCLFGIFGRWSVCSFVRCVCFSLSANVLCNTKYKKS